MHSVALDIANLSDSSNILCKILQFAVYWTSTNIAISVKPRFDLSGESQI